MSELLVVDLCGTLVYDNTTHSFLQQLPDGAGLVRSMLLSRIGHALAARLPALNHRRRLAATLAGCPRQRLSAAATAYARHALATRARPEVLRQVKEAGRQVVLASASLDVVVSAFAAELQIPVCVSTELEYDTLGVCTGRILRDSTGCKLARLTEALGRSPGRFDLITDNPEDTDLMQAAVRVQFIEAASD